MIHMYYLWIHYYNDYGYIKPIISNNLLPVFLYTLFLILIFLE